MVGKIAAGCVMIKNASTTMAPVERGAHPTAGREHLWKETKKDDNAVRSGHVGIGSNRTSVFHTFF